MPPPFFPNLAELNGHNLDANTPLTRVLADNAGPFTYTGTGTYILGNLEDQTESDLIILDPGPDDDDHLAALIKSLKGQKLAAILITHTHLDHSPLAKRLKAATGAVTYGFGPHGFTGRGFGSNGFRQIGQTGGAESVYGKGEEGADTSFIPDIYVKDGDILKIGHHSIKAFHTPGHTSNHICYLWENHQILFTGDHIMGWSTTVISPPDGNMALYIDSLKKLLAVECIALYPTHGPPIKDPEIFIRNLMKHRLEREAQIVRALRRSDHTVADLVKIIYPTIEEALKAAASQSVISHLIKLQSEGRISSESAFSLTSNFKIHFIG